MECWTNVQMDGWMNIRIDRQMDGCLDGWTSPAYEWLLN